MFSPWKILLFTSLFLVSCGTSEKSERTFQYQVNNGYCFDAAYKVKVLNDEGEIKLKKSKTGYIISWGTVTLLAPIDLMLLMRCRFGCPGEKDKDALKVFFPLGTWSYESMKGLRCDHYQEQLDQLVDVGRCFRNKGGRKNVRRSQIIFGFLKKATEKENSCVTGADQNRVGLEYEKSYSK